VLPDSSGICSSDKISGGAVLAQQRWQIPGTDRTPGVCFSPSQEHPPLLVVVGILTPPAHVPVRTCEVFSACNVGKGSFSARETDARYATQPVNS
jgi:hypothetical protein